MLFGGLLAHLALAPVVFGAQPEGGLELTLGLSEELDCSFESILGRPRGPDNRLVSDSELADELEALLHLIAGNLSEFAQSHQRHEPQLKALKEQLSFKTVACPFLGYANRHKDMGFSSNRIRWYQSVISHLSSESNPFCGPQVGLFQEELGDFLRAFIDSRRVGCEISMLWEPVMQLKDTLFERDGWGHPAEPVDETEAVQRRSEAMLQFEGEIFREYKKVTMRMYKLFKIMIGSLGSILERLEGKDRRFTYQQLRSWLRGGTSPLYDEGLPRSMAGRVYNFQADFQRRVAELQARVQVKIHQRIFKFRLGLLELDHYGTEASEFGESFGQGPPPLFRWGRGVIETIENAIPGQPFGPLRPLDFLDGQAGGLENWTRSLCLRLGPEAAEHAKVPWEDAKSWLIDMGRDLGQLVEMMAAKDQYLELYLLGNLAHRLCPIAVNVERALGILREATGQQEERADDLGYFSGMLMLELERACQRCKHSAVKRSSECPGANLA